MKRPPTSRNACCPHARLAPRSGLALLEVIVVLAILATLASLAHAFGRPSHTARAARTVRATILWARTEAMWRGAPVSVTELAGESGFLVSAAADPAAPCVAGTTLTRIQLSEHPGVRLAAGLPRGLVWLPTGSGRSCSGGGVISGTIELTDGRTSVRVIISSLGRVRLEAP